MLHKSSVSQALLELVIQLSSIEELTPFRLVGGTAIALHLGHRLSVDIDLFSNNKVNKKEVAEALHLAFPDAKFFVGREGIRATINEVRIDMYDDWHMGFRENAVEAEGIRLATLNDLAALKIEAITERREKKDYIDLYFLFKKLGAATILKNFVNYNPYLSPKSILFALGEVTEAVHNKSVMPDMLIDVSWIDIEKTMIEAARNFANIQIKKN